MSNSIENKGIFAGLSDVKMNELRKMIIGLDNEDLKRLALFINDPEAFADEISDLLPTSIKSMLDKGNISYEKLVPVIESLLHESIQKDPQTLSDILFPIMIPAIRKAVAEAMKNMVESLNSTLEHSFSPKRIGWRLKAIITGTSYAEIVLSHAYVFRVRQAFLIHKESGLLLESVDDESSAVAKDADMVSSMLSAIKDFVQDSFNVESENELNTINVGKFNIWIEQGPKALVAAIVDGDAHTALREQLKDAVEKVHLKQSIELDRFDGDTSVFEKSKTQLSQCIISEQRETKKKKPWVLIFLLLILLGIGGYFLWQAIQFGIKSNELLSELKSQNGIVITEHKYSSERNVYSGLRDPLAVDPYVLAYKYDFDSSDVAFDFKPYISLEDDIVLHRAKQTLKPPKSVKLSYRNGILYLSGICNSEWLDKVKLNYLYIEGVKNIDTKALEVMAEQSIVERRILSIEEYYFVFEYLTVKLTDAQRIKFENLIDEVHEMLDFNLSQDSVPVIVVLAHTSYQGNAKANKKVAFDRAQQFIALMINAGIPMEVLVPKTDYIEDIEEDFPVRSVSFKVIYTKPEDL